MGVCQIRSKGQKKSDQISAVSNQRTIKGFKSETEGSNIFAGLPWRDIAGSWIYN
jgi:hypothetical protein